MSTLPWPPCRRQLHGAMPLLASRSHRASAPGPVIEVMWFIMWMQDVAVEDPVAGVVGDELDVVHLGDADEIVLPGIQAVSGMRPPSVPVFQKVWPWRWIG